MPQRTSKRTLSKPSFTFGECWGILLYVCPFVCLFLRLSKRLFAKLKLVWNTLFILACIHVPYALRKLRYHQRWPDCDIELDPVTPDGTTRGTMVFQISFHAEFTKRFVLPFLQANLVFFVYFTQRYESKNDKRNSQRYWGRLARHVSAVFQIITVVS